MRMRDDMGTEKRQMDSAIMLAIIRSLMKGIK